MKRLTILIALIFVGLFLNAKEENCSSVTGEWKTEKDAITSIEQTTFNFSESLLPTQSSWLTSAHYYTCDNEYGYLIIKSQRKTFIHQDVPMAVWESLKNAKSTGGYYNFYIKNKYRFHKSNNRQLPL